MNSDDEEVFEFDDYFVGTPWRKLQAYQRLIFSLNMPGRLRQAYYETLRSIDAFALDDT